jgi:hypothetical protein
MNKYQIGQTVYWVRFSYNLPCLYSFQISSIKQDKIGFKYSSEIVGSNYIAESEVFLSKLEAIENCCNRLRRLLDE